MSKVGSEQAGPDDRKAVARPRGRPRARARANLQSQQDKDILEGLRSRRDAALGRCNDLSVAPEPAPRLAGSVKSVNEEDEPAEARPRSSPSPTLSSSSSPARRFAPGVSSTPAMEASIAALANFKRRPRQPSILRMVQQSKRNSDDDENIARDGGLAGGDGDGDGDSDGDISDLSSVLRPDDESTPLPNRKRRTFSRSPKRKRPHPQPQPRPRSRPADEADGPGFSSAPPSSPPVIELGTVPPNARLGTAADDPASGPPGPPGRKSSPGIGTGRHGDGETSSDIMAPPQSTSSLGDDAGSSADSGTADEAQQRQDGGRRPVTTADLLDMLPRMPRARKAAAAAAIEIPTSSSSAARADAEDASEDELVVARSRKKARTGHETSDKENAVRKRRHLRSVVQNNAQLRSDDDSSEHGSSTDEAEPRKRRKGAGLPNRKKRQTTTSRNDRVFSEELSKAAEKFHEVDQWKMEFESVDITGGSSSPWR